MSIQNITWTHKTALALQAFAIGIVALYLMRPIADPDFFWHMKTGQWILQHKALPDVDPFSLTSPSADNLRASFILTSYWLSQTIYAALYALGGWWGILLVRVALVGIMAALFASRCDQRQPANIGLLFLGAIQLLEAYPLERPQMFSFVCFTALLVLLDRYRDPAESEDGTGVFAALVVALMLVWSNLHGGFFVGQVTLLLFLVMEGVKFLHPSLSPLSRRRYSGLAIIVLAGLTASFINPNPINSVRLLLDVGATNTFLYTTNIEYFSSMRILREYGDYTIWLNWLMMALVTCRALSSLKRPDITWLPLLAGTAYMGCQHVRYMPFFLVAAILFLGKDSYKGAFGATFKILVVVTVLIAAPWFVRDETRNLSRFIRGQWGVDRLFPVRAADFCVQHDLKGPVYNTFLWGGYLIWRLGPERKIFCDGRLLDAGRYWEYLNSTVVARTDEPYWNKLFQKYGIQTAIVQMIDPSGSMNPLAASLRMDKGWAMVFAENNAAVFMRKENLKE